METHYIKTHIRAIAVVIIGTFALSALVALAAWSDPSSPPTSGNPSAPLNVGSSEQTKNGNLKVNGTFVMYGHSYLDGAYNTGDPSIALGMTERGQAGGTYVWKLWTSDSSGSGGLQPNAFELWEYPDSYVSPGAWYRARFKVLKSPANVVPSATVIDGYGAISAKNIDRDFLLLKAPDNSCWKVTVNNTGALGTVSVACNGL